MRNRRFTLLTAALFVLAGSMVFAKARPAVTAMPDNAAIMTMPIPQGEYGPGQEHHAMIRAHDRTARIYAHALYAYLTHWHGAMNNALVDEYVDGIDRGLRGAERHLGKMETHLGPETARQHEEIRTIRREQNEATQDLQLLRAAYEKAPADRDAMAQHAEGILDLTKKMDGEEQSLGNKLWPAKTVKTAEPGPMTKSRGKSK